MVQAGAATKSDAEANAQRQRKAGSRHAEHEANAIARAGAADAARLDAEALSAERGAKQCHDDLETRAVDAEHWAAHLRRSDRLRTV
jgi:hypothetical protein